MEEYFIPFHFLSSKFLLLIDVINYAQCIAMLKQKSHFKIPYINKLNWKKISVGETDFSKRACQTLFVASNHFSPKDNYEGKSFSEL